MHGYRRRADISALLPMPSFMKAFGTSPSAADVPLLDTDIVMVEPLAHRHSGWRQRNDLRQIGAAYTLIVLVLPLDMSVDA